MIDESGAFVGSSFDLGISQLQRGGHCEIQHLYSSLSPLRILPLPSLLLICPLPIYLFTLCRAVNMWKSAENLLELVLFFHRVGSWNRAPVTKVSSKHLYLLSQLATFLRHFQFFTGPAFHSLGPLKSLSRRISLSFLWNCWTHSLYISGLNIMMQLCNIIWLLSAISSRLHTYTGLKINTSWLPSNE